MEENTNVVTTENEAVETTKGGSNLGVAIVLGGAAFAGAVLYAGGQKVYKFAKGEWKKHKDKKAAKKNADNDVVDADFTEVYEEEFETEE